MASKTTPIIIFSIVLVSALLIYSYYLVGASAFNEGSPQGAQLEVSTINLPDSIPVVSDLAQGVYCPISEGADTDGDGVFDVCDNCADYYNPDQRDDDHDGIGNACQLLGRASSSGGGGSNHDIECNSNSECGTDGFIGGYFCTENNVTGIYKSYTCSDAGTEDSECSSTTEVRNVESCNNFCYLGECREVICSTDSDCDDGDSGTIDTCHDGGSVTSYCTNEPFECSIDSQCPDGGLSGNTFCVNDDIYQVYLSGMCVNPGQTTSMCDYESSDQYIGSCPFACAEGQCTICNEDSDCDDGDNLTADTCLMPGTTSSRCDHEFTGSCVPGTTMDCGSSDVGQCQLGVKTCGSNGEYGSCVGAIGPATEICDNLDNDCDGSIDEGNVCYQNTQIDIHLELDSDPVANPYVITFMCSILDANFPASLSFVFGDGNSQSFGPFNGPITKTVVHNFGGPGTYIASCTGHDDDGDSDTDEITIILADITPPLCNNNIDDDGDGYTDLDDPSCSGPLDDSEDPFDDHACNNGIDDDGDGLVDLNDPGCTGPFDNNEYNPPVCTDECVVGTTMCLNTDEFIICGYFDNDPCTEWSAYSSQCGFDQICQASTGQCI